MSKLSMLDYKITAKDDNYYINQCHSGNRTKRVEHRYGFNDFHQVEDKIVELQQHAVMTADDYDVELDNVIIHNNLPF